MPTRSNCEAKSPTHIDSPIHSSTTAVSYRGYGPHQTMTLTAILRLPVTSWDIFHCSILRAGTFVHITSPTIVHQRLIRSCLMERQLRRSVRYTEPFDHPYVFRSLHIYLPMSPFSCAGVYNTMRQQSSCHPVDGSCYLACPLYIDHAQHRLSARSTPPLLHKLATEAQCLSPNLLVERSSPERIATD